MICFPKGFRACRLPVVVENFPLLTAAQCARRAMVPRPEIGSSAGFLFNQDRPKLGSIILSHTLNSLVFSWNLVVVMLHPVTNVTLEESSMSPSKHPSEVEKAAPVV